MRYLALVSISVLLSLGIRNTGSAFLKVYFGWRVCSLRQVPRNRWCFFPSPSCSARLSLSLCLSSPLFLKTFPFQVSLWNKTGSQYLQVIPVKSQHAPFLGHHMKGSMRQTGDAVDVCVSMFGFLFILNVYERVGGECVYVTPCEINLPTHSRRHLAGQRVPLCHMSDHLQCVFRKRP